MYPFKSSINAPSVSLARPLLIEQPSKTAHHRCCVHSFFGDKARPHIEAAGVQEMNKRDLTEAGPNLLLKFGIVARALFCNQLYLMARTLLVARC